MDTTYYLNAFKSVTTGLEKSVLKQKQLEVATGVVLESVFLKLYKRSWANQSQDPLTSASRIFFSIWVNEKSIKQGRILYNIHALKLRRLQGYALTSQQFAGDFREQFKRVEHHWPNVELNFGPQTLMQGWIGSDDASFRAEMLKLANQFLTIDHLIDNLLEKKKRK